jgi:2-octaprenylphenol hydroxylase
MKVWDAEGTGAIEFSAAEIGEPCLGHIVENSATTQALRQALSHYSNIELIAPHKVVSMCLHEEQQQQKIILEDGQELSAPLIVAADGALSMIRDLAGFEMREWDYGHSAIVTTVKTEHPHQYTAWQRFMPEGPLAFLPLQTTENGDDHYCSIVWSAQTHYAENLMSFSDEVFAEALGASFEYRLGKIVSVAKRFSFPLRQRHAKTYFKPGVTLIGDAAHTIHPLAGLGVNLGFADVDALSNEIHRALARKIPLSHPSILARYQRQRMGKNLATMGVMEGFKRLFAQTALPARWMRNEGMRQMNHLDFVKRQIIKQAMGI